ncbi:MAG: hypothetical protein IJR95_03150 [Lachnospiraceae bacterium]|nr:hypothetical protein [Lachnospiraceae bacterium]
MKNRISAGAGILLALLLCLSGISVRAAWSDFGLPESGQGSVSLTLAYEKDDAGQRSRVAVAGVGFRVYQLWTLSSDGSARVQAPFNELLQEEDLFGDTAFNEPAGTAPKEAIRKMAGDLAELAEGQEAAVYAVTKASDSQGRTKLTKLPFGAYLFVPVNQAGDVTKVVTRGDGTREEYTVAPFLLTVPVRADSPGTLAYQTEVEGFVKLSVWVKEVPPATEPPTEPVTEPPTTTTEAPTTPAPTTEEEESEETDPDEWGTWPPGWEEETDDVQPDSTPVSEPPTEESETESEAVTESVAATSTVPVIDKPDTGDYTDFLPWALLLAAGMAGCLGLLMYVRKKEA